MADLPFGKWGCFLWHSGVAGIEKSQHELITGVESLYLEIFLIAQDLKRKEIA